MKERKLRVLIVEDEIRIAQLIKKLIKWDEIGLECVGIANNGKTALDIINECDPDIVVTDIRMPKINGLELISRIKQNNEHIRFIVVSGYKEFEYAHKAIQYGVNNYLLKPINEDEINKVLREIYADINQNLIKRKEEEDLKKELNESRRIIKSEFLSNIIENIDTISHEELEELAEKYNLEFTGDAYMCADIKLDYWDYEKHDEKQDRLTVEQIIAIVDKNFKGRAKELIICGKENLHIYCLVNYDLSRSKEIKDSINNILTEIQEYLFKFELYEATIGIGCEVTEPGKIRESVSEAFRSVQNRIKYGIGRLIYSKSLPLENKIDIDGFLHKHKEKYLMSIESYSKEFFEQSINEIFGDISSRNEIDFSFCYDIADRLINMFFDNVKIKNDEGVALKRYMLNTYQHCYTLVRLKNLLARYLGEYLEFSLNYLKSENVKPIRIAKQYINEHYFEKIVLEDIANMVGLNPVYFSVLFKKETGMNFSNYLINLRMEKAKDLLRSTNDTMVAIADSVGYKDTKYFSQLFAKTVGIKPALYRRLHS
ncbi:MAG: response regulator transcription factor [Bacillota bacterium]